MEIHGLDPDVLTLSSNDSKHIVVASKNIMSYLVFKKRCGIMYIMKSNKILKHLLFFAVITVGMLLIGGCAPNIENLKDKQDVEGLIRYLGYESDINVQESAAEALGLIGDKRAVEPLIEALKDEVSGVRNRAAVAIGNIKDARAVGPLIKALEDEDEVSNVRDSAAEALGKIRK